ncbi:lipopolysaccharide biosynthesis protein [Arthrobacter sp. NPDC055585]
MQPDTSSAGPRHRLEPEAQPRPPEPENAGELSAAAVGDRTASGVRWSMLSVLAKQGFQLLCAVVLARLLGPESYGIISVTSIFVVFVTLLLDQGLSAALIQRPGLSNRAAGATFTVNLILAVLVGGLTWLSSEALADFFRVQELELVLKILALAIPLKALSITPRAMLARDLRFRGISTAEIGAAVAGSAAGITAALLGATYFSVLYQVIVTDLVTAAVLLAATRGPRPNLHFGEVRALLPFSLRVFATNGLAYFSRNIDNILVGRVLGVTSLSLYGMAYRVLVVPVQLIGQTVNRVMFPAFSRLAADPELVAGKLRSAMAFLALCVVPLMAFTACAAPVLVDLVLGESWSAAAPLMSVLAIGGARETVFYLASSLMKGMGRAGLNLKYEVVATAAQVGGILVGLQYGLLGVALGYTIAGFVLTPVLLVLQSRLCPLSVRAQLRALWPPIHASIWGSAAYLLLDRTDLSSVAALPIGLAVFLCAAAATLFLFHRRTLAAFPSQLARFVRPGKRTEPGAQ